MIVAYRMARTSTTQTHFLVFWVGFIAALLAIAIRGVSTNVGRAERAILITSFGLLTFLPKFLMSVNAAVYRDEYPHWAQVNNMVASGNLRPTNSLLPVIRDYPGLETLTYAIHEVTRLSTWHSGQIIIVIAHCASLFSVAAIARAVGATDRGAVIAAVVFGLNPSFTYFDTQYSYESLALPLALAAVAACVKARRAQTVRQAWTYAGLGALAALGCVVTHHASSIAMAVMCLAVAALVPTATNDTLVDATAVRAARAGGWVVAAVASIGTVLWIGVVATDTIGYLSPHFTSALHQVLQSSGIQSPKRVDTSTGVVVAPTQSHQLFKGSLSPRYEQIAGLAAPFILLGASIFGLSGIWERRRRVSQWRLVGPFVLLAGAYFVSLPIALTGAGNEIAHRSWAFSFAGLGVVIALGFRDRQGAGPAEVGRRVRVGRLAQLGWKAYLPIMGLCLAVVAAGNIAAGQSVYYRFPGPYIFGSDTRSTSAEQLAAVRWLGAHAAPNTGVVTDLFTADSLAAYTRLRVPNLYQATVFGIYSRPELPSPRVRSALKAGNFSYFILDTRIENQLPVQSFFEGYRGYTRSINPVALKEIEPNSFISAPVYRSTHYVIYRIYP